MKHHETGWKLRREKKKAKLKQVETGRKVELCRGDPKFSDLKQQRFFAQDLGDHQLVRTPKTDWRRTVRC